MLDLYAASVAYDPRSPKSIAFFKMVQNKLYFAVHGHTTAEVIYECADADKPFMGLKTFSGDFPVKKDIAVTKNDLEKRCWKVSEKSGMRRQWQKPMKNIRSIQ